MFLPRKIMEEKLQHFLAEDLGQGDITTALTIPKNTVIEAIVVTKQAGIAAGIEEATILLESLGLTAETQVEDGDEIKPKQVLIKISGNARTILSVERTVLDIVSRMSGIATMTRRLVEALQKAKFKTRIACTRKTAPGLAYFDKKAVSIGGGDTHRLHLDDMVLIKDNHIAVAGSLEKALKTVRKSASFSKKIEVETASTEEALSAAKEGADIIMLDNFSPKQIAETVETLKKAKLYGKSLLEASGGITSKNILKFASTGVHIVSLGELTHSTRALNVSLEITKTNNR